MAEVQLYLIVSSILVVLCGLGTFLLLLRYQNKKLCFPSFWKERESFQGKVKKKRKEQILQDWQDFKKEVEEGKKVLFLLKSPLGHHHNTICIRQRPESICDVCNSATEISQLSYPDVLEECTRKQDTKSMMVATSSHSTDRQEHIFVSVPETRVSEHTAPQHLETNRLSFLALTIQEHLKSQLQKRAAFQILDKETDTRLLYRKISTEYSTQTLSEESLQSDDIQDTEDPTTDFNSESKAEKMSTSHQLLYIKSFKDNMQQKNSQLFWGLPSLHSESLVATVLVSGKNNPLDPHFVYFNGICNAPMVQKRDQEYTAIPYYHPLPFSKVYSDPFASSKYQPQHLHFTQPQIQPQIHLQPERPILPSFLPQTRDSGVPFYRYQNETNPHIPSENKYLERNMLQKQQERLWGLIPMLKKSQGITYPQNPNTPLVNQSSKVYVPVSLLNGHFHITNESQQNPTPHLPRRPVPHWCVHTCRNPASPAVMERQCTAAETAQHNARRSYSQHSERQGQNNKDLANAEWHLLGSFHKRNPTKSQLQNDGRRNLCHILGKSPEESPQRITECYVEEELGTAPETRNNGLYYTRSHSGSGLFNIFRKDIGSNQVKTILRLHLSRKFWQMTMGRIPICVCRSWLADGNTLSYGSPQANMENTELGNTRGRAHCHITTSEPSFLDSNTRQLLESHIIRFRASQRWGIPLKAVKSIKLYMSREAKTWPLPQFEVPSAPTNVSRLVSKADASKSPEKQSQETFQENQVITAHSVSCLDCPIPDPSSVDHERWEGLERSPPNVNEEFAVDFQGIEIGGQAILSVTHSGIDKVSQTEMNHICQAEVPTMQNGTDQEAIDRNVWFCDNIEVIQEENMVNNNLERILMPNVSREIFKAEELWCPQSQSSDSSTSRESQSSQTKILNENKAQTTVFTECITPETTVYESAKLFDIIGQGVNNLEVKSGEHREVKRSPSSISVTSNSSSKSSLIHVHSTSSGDTGSPHVQLEDRKIRIEHQQELNVSQQDPLKCHDNNFQPDTRIDFQAGEYGQEGSGVQTYTIGKSHEFAEDRILKDTSPSLSQSKQYQRNIQFPQSFLRKKMRRFFQWLDTKRQTLGQEQLLQKFKLTSILVHPQDPLGNAATSMSCNSPEGIELMTAIGDMLEQKLTQMHTPDSSVIHQQAQIDNRQHPSTDGAFPDPHQRTQEPTKPCNHEAVSLGQSCLRYVQQVLDKHKLPSAVMAFEEQTQCQSHSHSLPLRRLINISRPFCTPQVGQTPPVATSHDENTVFSDLKLLFQQKALLQHYKE